MIYDQPLHVQCTSYIYRMSYVVHLRTSYAVPNMKYSHLTPGCSICSTIQYDLAYIVHLSYVVRRTVHRTTHGTPWRTVQTMKCSSLTPGCSMCFMLNHSTYIYRMSYIYRTSYVVQYIVRRTAHHDVRVPTMKCSSLTPGCSMCFMLNHSTYIYRTSYI